MQVYMQVSWAMTIFISTNLSGISNLATLMDNHTIQSILRMLFELSKEITPCTPVHIIPYYSYVLQPVAECWMNFETNSMKTHLVSSALVV